MCSSGTRQAEPRDPRLCRGSGSGGRRRGRCFCPGMIRLWHHRTFARRTPLLSAILTGALDREENAGTVSVLGTAGPTPKGNCSREPQRPAPARHHPPLRLVRRRAHPGHPAGRHARARHRAARPHAGEAEPRGRRRHVPARAHAGRVRRGLAPGAAGRRRRHDDRARGGRTMCRHHHPDLGTRSSTAGSTP